MPRIENYLEALRGMKYFALLDLAQGYYQIELSPKERAKTVFVTCDENTNIHDFGWAQPRVLLIFNK